MLCTVCLEGFLSIEHIMPGSLFASSYDDMWYFCVAIYISEENYNVEIKFLQLNGPTVQFLGPSLEDTCCIPIHDIITKVDPASYGSTGQFYCFDYDQMNCVKKMMWFNWHPFQAESLKKQKWKYK